MTDYETLAWPWTGTADYDDRAGRMEDLTKLDKTHRSVRDSDGSALLWQYVSDTHGYMTSDDADDEADGVAFERRQTARLLFVGQDSDTEEEEEEEEHTDDDEAAEQDVDAFPGWADDNDEEEEEQDTYFVIDHDNGTVLSLTRDARSRHGTAAASARNDDNKDRDDEAEPAEGDAQRTYADALVAALGDVDEVHMHGDGSVALRKDRHLPVVLMGGVDAPAKIADASITAAQAPDGVTAFLGEVALLGDEVGAAERALLADDAGAVVTALHNHWVSEPTLYYLHFQALTRDPAAFLGAVAPWWRSL
ncbi:hypothetical protein pneo_cds_829 [Pandoravirus neocaledonia]|uniref:Uncharacterized protein n=1 Tax=Pandoravirus neocaledonia TaxID=2107708 RepID=A0A2U7UDC8_9VIRU|nr:hypothetical protein pneo_cds_829 [Pandoravirus neocaledonia]AVK76436.1 hypothetical protein pneo_cds_829 [Pandoravirus neocaledonia]